MGIKNFHSWIKNNYFGSILQNNGEPFEHIYIDLNYILHKILSYSDCENVLFENVVKNIEYIMSTNSPLKTINLVADGTAGKAKMSLQKKRRLECDFDDDKLSSIHLTAGTKLMDNFNAFIVKYAEKINSQHNITVNTILSDVHGEAEFKICQLIIKNSSDELDRHLIVSNDADMVLIALAIKECYNIYIIFQQSKSESYIISTNVIIEKIYDIFGANPNKRFDFVLVSLLNGNDYFPKLRYTSFEKLWRAYENSISNFETIVDSDCNINTELFIRFINCINIQLPKIYMTSSLEEFNDPHIHMFIIGLQWCLKLYRCGKYDTYDYVYEGGSISPICVILFLSLNSIHTIKIPSEKINILSPKDYSRFVLPAYAKHLI